MNVPLLITDLDNTLYNWVDFFAPSFRAMVHVINKETDIPEDIITQEFQKVYQKFGVIEYSYSVEALQIFNNLSKSKLKALTELTGRVFVNVGRKHLIPYAGVTDTLRWAQKSGVRLICVTNAPINLAEWRLHQLRLSTFFYGLAGREALEEKKGKRRITGISKRWEFSVEDLKPNPVAYNQIIDSLKVDVKDVYVVGDSMEKDVKPALRIGATGIWAKYGGVCEKKNIDTIKSITTLTESTFSSLDSDDFAKPELQINAFSELRHILRTPQMNFPGFS